jgi:hypothetical protein
MKIASSTLSSVLAIALAAGTLHAQCGGFVTDPDQGLTTPFPFVFGNITTTTQWDPDGVGPLEPWLVLGGSHGLIGTVTSLSIAAWDGQRWHSFGSGFANPALVRSLASNDGTLYAAIEGASSSLGPVARWTGSQWQRADQPSSVSRSSALSLTSHQGSLFAAGFLSPPGSSVPTSLLARLDGDQWTLLGPISPSRAVTPRLLSTSTDLLLFGIPTVVTPSGTVAINNAARWDGQTWQTLGQGLNGTVRDAIVFNGEVYAVGSFTASGDIPLAGIARFDGTQWVQVGDGTPGQGFTLAEINSALHVVANNAQGVQQVYRLEGQSWVRIDNVTSSLFPFPVSAGSLFAQDLVEYQGAPVFLGLFQERFPGSAPNGPLNGVFVAPLQPDGTFTTYLPLSGGFNSTAITHAVEWNNSIVASGNFRRAGLAPSRGIARWDGRDWSAMPPIPSGDVGFSPRIDALGDRLFAAFTSAQTNTEATTSLLELINGQWQPRATLAGMPLPPSARTSIFGVIDYQGLPLFHGTFNRVDSQPASGLARLTSGQLEPLTIPGLTSAIVLDAVAEGQTLILTGLFFANNQLFTLARWDGGTTLSLFEPTQSPSATHRGLFTHNGATFAYGSYQRPQGFVSGFARVTDQGLADLVPMPTPPVGTFPTAPLSAWNVFSYNGRIWTSLPVAGPFVGSSVTIDSILYELLPDNTWVQRSPRVTPALVGALGTSGVTSSNAFPIAFANELHLFGSFSAADGVPAVNWARFSPEGVPGAVLPDSISRIPCGETLTIDAVVPRGYQGLSFAWSRDDQPLAPSDRVLGVDTPTLSIINAQPSDSGVYTLTITNGCTPPASTTTSVIVTVGSGTTCDLCPECAADFDRDGGVTSADIGAFFTTFEHGQTCADIDADGSVTAADVAAFFDTFQRGGC